jgi:S1-C subfamily serine protease
MHRALKASRYFFAYPVLWSALWSLIVSPVARADEALVDLARQAKGAVVALKIVDRFGGELGLGSGFYVTDAGWIATNLHVVEGGTKIRAQLADGTLREIAGLLAVDEDNDLAVLQAVQGPDAVPQSLPLGDSGRVETGSEVVVLGNPLGLSGTLSKGIISAVRDDPWEMPEGHTEPLLQIDAAISPGSSGSPVMNLEGEVVGVVVSQYLGGQNLNFAIPSAALKKLLQSIEPGATASSLVGGPATPGGAEVSSGAYARNVGISLLFFAALYFGYRRLI